MLGGFMVALLAFAGLFALYVGGIGYWILGPMHRATRESKLPTQFFVSDFIWLVAQVQFALAAVMMTPYRPGSFGWGLLLMGAAASVAAMWWASVTALCRAGVLQPLRRATFVLLVVPASTVGGVLTFFLLMLGLGALYQRFVDKDERVTVAWIVLVLPAVAALFVASRWLSLWVLAGGERVRPESVAEASADAESPNRAATDNEPGNVA